MLSTAIGIQFNVNDLNANYEVVGTSDNYSFQYDLGEGSKLVDFEGDFFQKSISLEGNYGEFDVRVFASSDIGIRSEFIESTISISPPEFDNTFTFNNLRISNLPDNPNVGLSQVYIPQSEGDKLEVSSEYINKNVEISWSLVPPAGHVKEGQSLTSELLKDTFFEKFEISFTNGTGSQIIDEAALASSAGMQSSLSTADVTGLLNEYRDFSLTLNDSAFDDIGFDRTFAIQIVSHDSFGRTATGLLTGINYESTLSNFSYSLRGSDASFSWFSNDTDFSGVNVTQLALPSNVNLIDDNDIDTNIDYFTDLSLASSWNFGFGDYQSGDMVTFDGDAYRSLQAHSSNSSNAPGNILYWQNIGQKVDFSSSSFNAFDDQFENSQVWGYSYYYSLQASDGYGPSSRFNLTDSGLISNGKLKPLTSEVRIQNLRFRERQDDLIFNWEVTDQDGNLVDLEQYKFALSNSDTPSVLGISGSLFDSNTQEFVTGITEGNNARASTINEFGQRTILFDLPNTNIFDTYEFTREINNNLYGTGDFVSNFPLFNDSTIYLQNQYVTDSNKNIYKSIEPNTNNEKPIYDLWSESITYNINDYVEYENEIYQAGQQFGPTSNNIVGVFEYGSNYNSGELVISPSAEINTYFPSQAYIAGDIVLYNQTVYLALLNQSEQDDFTPGTNRNYWRTLSLFDEVASFVYSAKNDIVSSTGVPFVDSDNWQIQTPEASEYFNKVVEQYPLDVSLWSNINSYQIGELVLYDNNVWSGIADSGPVYNSAKIPSQNPDFWTNADVNLGFNIGDRIYANNFVYKASQDNPNGSPIPAVLNSGDSVNSNYYDCGWIPFWERDDSYEGFVYGHVGIPESGKRSIGLEVGIISNTGEILNSESIIGINSEPSIIPQGFQVDSLTEASKVKFNFNYALGSQEKTSKVHLYRSSSPNFDITGANGFPISETGNNSPLAKIVFGAGDATFGDNITQIIDEPPIPNINGLGDQITGYYYKILPFDDFGTGDIFGVNDNQGSLERVLAYPKNFNNNNPNGVIGPVFRTSKDDIPGAVQNFSGATAFENYFLNWSHPNSEIGGLQNVPNDLSHYEVWMSEEDRLELGSLNIYLKDQADPNQAIDFSNTSGYRRIESDIESVGPIPIEKQDPASGVTNATNIFNVSAKSPIIETSYLGKTNDTRYFWVRAVDQAGNKSPFTGAANLQDQYIRGFELTLGQATATDISDFEVNMTEKFGNTIALVPNDPFVESATTPGDVTWANHVLYYQGTGYVIGGDEIGPSFGDSDTSYIWWKNDTTEYNSIDPEVYFQNNGLRSVSYSGAGYRLSDNHPAGSNGLNQDPDFQDGDFIVARVNNGIVTPVYHAFANALIGTANIAEAAIISAKINDLSADKITAGQVQSADIQLSQTGSQVGTLRSVGFAGINHSMSQNGFFLKGDGTFSFQQGGSSLGFENGTLTLAGNIRQTSGYDYDFIDISATPNNFNYLEVQSGYQRTIGEEVSILIDFRNSSISQASDVRIKAFGVKGDGSEYNIGSISNNWYDVTTVESVFDDNHGQNNFTYVSFAQSSGSAQIILELDSEGFDSCLNYGSNNGESIVIYIKSIHSNFEKKHTIGRIIDGKTGLDGATGATGEMGRSPTYRGLWSSSETYLAISGTITKPGRGDIVKYGNNYYICINTSTGIAPTNTQYWIPFGAQFDNVATNILLTQDAYITNELIMGNNNSDGGIKSNGFVGGFNTNGTLRTSQSYNPAGFRLDRIGTSTALFDVGGRTSTGSDTYIRFSTSTGKVEIKGGFTNNSVLSDINVNSLTSSDPQAIFIGGGYNNSITETVSAGNFNSLGSSIVGGAENLIEARFSFIGNGYANVCKDNFSAITAGYNNQMSYASAANEGANFIGAGQNNTINGGTNQAIICGSNNTIQN